MLIYDRIIIGAGFYGLYAALFCARKGEAVAVIEMDSGPFSRATYSNQARIHMGYHYPRSFATAIRSAHYFERFNKEFEFCIHSRFEQIYAISKNFSWTNAEQFKSFSRAVGIPCEEISVSRYFKASMCGGAFLTREYTYDAQILRRYFVAELEKQPRVRIYQMWREMESHFLCILRMARRLARHLSLIRLMLRLTRLLPCSAMTRSL
jgi:glycine/D-amino acid oxidase-like deaminating enzyme